MRSPTPDGVWTVERVVFEPMSVDRGLTSGGETATGDYDARSIGTRPKVSGI